MQGHHLLHHHHQQQLQHQLGALLSAALPQPGSKTVDADSSSVTVSSCAALDDAERGSLQRAIIYPPNSLLIANSATFLSQGLSQLLSDNCGCLRFSICCCLRSPLSSNGRQNHAILSGGVVDRFIGWALPLIRDVGIENGSAELAFEGLRKFLDAGDSNSSEGYALQILKSCQDLLEDERTPLNLLRQLLSVLTLIALKYGQCFQPHFVDIVDLLLGWALVPDLSELDRKIIMDSFMQFKNQWLGNLQFSLSLLSKFLGDMEVLVQDGTLWMSQQSGRLLALFCCFSSVIQVTASGILEKNLQTQIIEPLEGMVPRLLGCLLVVGKKLGWDKWMAESWRCLVLLAEVLHEKFAKYYATVIDILFQSSGELPSSLLQQLLKNNKKVLSLQKLGLLPSSIHKMLQFGCPFSKLRLHPNRSVVGIVASTYLFVLQHNCGDVVSQAISLLTEELELLKNMLVQVHGDVIGLRAIQMDGVSEEINSAFLSRQTYSEPELISLIKFDLSVMLSCDSLGDEECFPSQIDVVTSQYMRSKKLASFVIENLDPFQSPMQDILELQVHVAKALGKLSEVEFRSRLILFRSAEKTTPHDLISENGISKAKESHLSVFVDHMKNYGVYIVRLLSESSPLAVKLEALDFLCSLCRIIMKIYGDSYLSSFCVSCGYEGLSRKLLCSVLGSASDMEVKIRLRVASVLELLLQARLISPKSFYYIAEVSIDRLGDHDIDVKNSFIRILSIILPVTTYHRGIFESGVASFEKDYLLNWKHLFALKKLSRQLRSQQLLTILSYISQRSKVPLSSWIQRLASSCHNMKDLSSSQQEEKENSDSHGVPLNGQAEDNILDKLCPVNDLAVVWWSIHEAARHCVTLRLRTNLGGPTQTFAALERMLLDISQVLLLDSDQSEGNLNIGSSHIHLLPMRWSCILPCPTRQSSLFFRANKKVCEEWFSRICEPMLNASLALHCNDDLQNIMLSSFKDKTQGMTAIENLNILKGKLAGDVMKVLRNASLALCRSHEPEALVGLHNWAVMTYSSLFMEDGQLSTGHNDNAVHFSWMMGLVYQAYGQYEKAAAHFSHSLQSEVTLSSLGSDGIQFAIARIVECYTSVSDWKSLEIWLSELQVLRATHAGKVYCGALTAAGTEMNATYALARFDEGDIQGSWTYLDLTPKSSNELTLDLKMGLERSEQMLLRAMLQIDQKDKMPEELNKAQLMLNEALSVICLDGLAEAAAYAMQLHCIFAFRDNSKFEGEDQSKQPSALLSSLYQVLQTPLSKVHQDCTPWLKVFRVYRTLMPSSPVTLLFCKRLMDLARKQSNFMLADRMRHYLNDHMSTCWKGDELNLFSAELNYEKILFDYSMGKHEEALISLWSFVLPEMMSPKSITSASGKVLKAKAFLKLSSWLKQDHLIPNLENIIYRIQGNFREFSVHNASSLTRTTSMASDDNLISGVNWNVLLEEIVGMSVKLSCIICPHMCKTWLCYASWCYNQARNSLYSKGTVLQSCTLSSVLVPEVLPDRFLLTEEETSKVETLITRFLHHRRHTINSGDLDDKESGIQQQPINEAFVNSLVQRAAYLIQSTAGAPGIEHSDGECPSYAISSQLQIFFHRANSAIKKDDILMYANELVDIWWLLRRRRVSLFGQAAHGYLQYLSYSSSKILEGQYDQPDLSFSNEKAGSCTLRATLYVLQILLNFGVELKEILGPGLARVPLPPWQKQLEGLLMMLAKQSPWSIVYPALVDANALDGKSSEELSRILACLLIQDVQLVISELGAITVLWEDQWLNVIKRINTLKEEAVRISENATLSHSEKNKINAAKYSAMMAPVVVALERRLASTSREPETPHEVWFQKEYGEQLKSAILSFKSPPTSAMNLGDVWRPFDGIAASLVAYQRKPLISLSEVAPRLALLRSSDVPMPGLEKQISTSEASVRSNLDINNLVTVSSFCENLVILSTKTRPKKLVLRGSDGQEHPYLLKGREDLRLDARVMQLLHAVDSFLHSCSDTRSRSLAVRYYSVTPISGRAGLIQWVDNVISIYSVYKSWQTRVQLSHLSAVGSGNLKNTVGPVPRPSDMFYGKILPALKEKGIRKVVSRRDWPHDVKRKVLLDLMKETPRQLLHQELWCASEGFKAFIARSKRFSGSVAVMSMVGHILGLGDRHLDNILIDFVTGDVVHIDYNVCFDKGKRLKIPEIVPFRLTQTIEAALGLTGIGGIFKDNCGLFLISCGRTRMYYCFFWKHLCHDEAAIGGEEKKGMELAVSLSLFASRFQEVRVPLQEHHDLLLATLPASASALEKFLDVLSRYEIVSAIFFCADQERSSLLQREMSAKSIVAEATSISEKAQSCFEVQARELAQAKGAVMEKAQESAKWLEHHGRILDALQSGSADELQSLMKLTGSEEALSVTSSVSVAGVPLSIVPEPTQAQCYDLDREVSRIVAELNGGLLLAIDSPPLNYITTSPVHGWAQVLQLSVNKLSPDMLSLARRQATDLIAKTQDGIPESFQQRHGELVLKVEQYANEIDKVRNECSELVNSLGSDTEGKSKDRLLCAFTKYMQSVGYPRKEDEGWRGRHDVTRDSKPQGDLVEKAAKVLSILRLATDDLFKGVRNKVSDILSNSSRIGWRSGKNFEEQIEKCVLVVGFANELQGLMGVDLPSYIIPMDDVNWASVFQSIVLPEVIRSVISYNTEVMEAFGSLSQIRGSVDTALEQLIEVELERSSLMELEENYFVKVGLITEQKLALEQASVKGRENLSWEEAEELASQEEACRAQLDQLHQNWNQKDMRSSALKKREANVINSLVASERQLLSLVRMEEGDLHSGRSKALLAMLVKPFSELESLDQMFSSYGIQPSSSAGFSFNVMDFINSGYSLSESTWKLGDLLKSHSFFVWKICVMDSFLDSCIRDISSSVDHNLGFDQLYNIMKRKLSMLLQGQFNLYLRERIGPALMLRLEKEDESLQQLAELSKEMHPDHAKRDFHAVKRVQQMLQEYCNAHESTRAAESAVSLMKRQTVLEIVQMEWLFDLALPYQYKIRELSQNILSADKLSPAILNLSRHKLLEKMQSSMTSITTSLEHLKACDRTSTQTEAQLERAMSWACAGPSTVNTGSSLVKNSGIPTEFHDHLLKRRQLLWAVQEQASKVISICTSVMAFEASRDGLFRIPGDTSAWRTTDDSRTWQKTYLNSLTRLDAIFHTFTRAEQEWKLAQTNLGTAANSLLKATNELSIASVKAKSASGDLQSTLAALRDFAYEASVALSAFSHVSKFHNTLTSECGNMLEEVLAITEGVHDVYRLGKEAAALHTVLMSDLSKANAILLPLEVSLSTDVAAMSDAMSRERETRPDISPMHGQALYKFYCFTLRESCQLLKSLVPSITYSVKELHTMVTRLARLQALEGLGESQMARSQEFSLSSEELKNALFDDGRNLEVFGGADGSTFQDDAWISPPDSIYSSSSFSVLTSSQVSLSENADRVEQLSAPSSEEPTIDSPRCSVTESVNSRNSEPPPAPAPVEPSESMQALCLSDMDEPTRVDQPYSSEKETPNEAVPVRGENETLNPMKGRDGGVSATHLEAESFGVKNRKNPYAVSVLRQVESKLDGKEIDEKRAMSIAEQVDHLLKQATSVDNLCNMYEGWTPWI
ncbi:unnamed protein product [Spirodela intermedia]|uniref:non-specific serine/threonine protein kinase n=1 Tax=Spirodela intermedia TaxID=51605 RepID=A0A7I8IKV5_SPIIN|nr:unnamed protein product [Spirodela intermedia]CAA6657772.1 unnamed protein product [Spirodela intermedia]